jgi:transketolase
MPSCEVFLQQDPVYQENILPASCTQRIAIEAGSSQPWYRFVGLNGLVIGIDSFGKSAPSADLAEIFELTVDGVLSEIRRVFKVEA